MTVWKTDQILAHARDEVAKADLAPDDLAEWCARLLAAAHPFTATLSPLLDAPDECIWVQTAFSPFQRNEDEIEADAADWESWGSQYADGKWSAVEINYCKPCPKVVWETGPQIDAGSKIHDSYPLMSVSGTYSVASIFYGSFSTDDVDALCKAVKPLKLDPRGAKRGESG